MPSSSTGPLRACGCGGADARIDGESLRAGGCGGADALIDGEAVRAP